MDPPVRAVEVEVTTLSLVQRYEGWCTRDILAVFLLARYKGWRMSENSVLLK